MGSTFMGLETSKRGLYTQQSALYTTGHNISNANTLGYSRQRVNMEATLGYPGTGLNAPKIPGHLGTGVQAQSVQRIRDQFIDRQYRQETTKLGYWESRTNAISQMEDIMAEPSEFGLNTSLDQFWKSLQDLSTNPENAAARKVVVQRGIGVAESFNYINKQLSDIQGNIKNEILTSTDDINSILKQIASMNEQIQAIEPNGYMPNDLYDARDNLLDELSQYFPIEIEYTKSGGNSLAIAEGSVKVSIKTKTGSIEIINGKDAGKLTPNGMSKNDNFEPFNGFTLAGSGAVTGGPISYDDMELNKGKMLSLINSYGHGTDATNAEGYYPEMLAKLDKMANEFAKTFNAIHEKGHPLAGSADIADFFDVTNQGAAGIKVNADIIKNPGSIAASNSLGEEGNGAIAILLANMKSKILDGQDGNGDLDGATVQSFYQSMIGQLGVDGEQAARLAYNSATIKLTVENNRASVSSVSLDEEMTNMIIFQQAYNASARMITVVDETLDKIINGMGRVGL
ncbi:flagellar hook-associated protein FlgK [Psychrobacillus sp. INOP01]|uniref:flagellar hook-associated protein FlgK n=1 Tax=Psychrobacillus sp. INOP01 TaxID=2829187 RepID=UPI001BAE29B0|nr:flagellar hook-associated protein FlgK [Psychrobacillus sp. INOP01]QUG40788.1 flagellar hook-associated protein FlgK [Psychrobacillus sp. INOP01]